MTDKITEEKKEEISNLITLQKARILHEAESLFSFSLICCVGYYSAEKIVEMNNNGNIADVVTVAEFVLLSLAVFCTAVAGIKLWNVKSDKITADEVIAVYGNSDKRYRCKSGLEIDDCKIIRNVKIITSTSDKETDGKEKIYLVYQSDKKSDENKVKDAVLYTYQYHLLR